MKTLFAALVLTLGIQTPVLASWNLNDVSYLLPLPEKLETNGLLGLHSPARGGGLLPSVQAMAKLPPLAIGMTREQSYQALRVMAVRIDPCFPLPTPQSCQRQIRLVWQPLQMGPRSAVRTVDASMHSFYVLNDAEFSALLRDLTRWKTKYRVATDGLPLQVHPAWAQEGDRSAALQDFQRIITKHAGVQNLIRVTMMVLRGTGDMWAFAGFSYQQDQLEFIGIPRINNRSQAFVNFAVPADRFSMGQITPTPAGDDTFNNLMFDSDQMLPGNNKDDLLLKELTAIARIENPRIYNPENMDCVSCHVAQQGKQWSLLNRPDLQIADTWNAMKYKNARHNLNNESSVPLNTQDIRAFGYFGRNVSLSQRVINESAEVADAVNAWLAATSK